MKKLLFALLLMLSLSTKAQPPLTTQIDNLIAWNYTNIGLPTCFHCVTHTDHWYVVDSTLKMMKITLGLIGSAGNLDAVLASGNSSGHFIDITDGTNHTYHYPQYIATYIGAANKTLLGLISGVPTLLLQGTGSTSNKITANSVGNYINAFPAEGTNGLPGTFVTHTTKDIVTVTSPLDTTYVMGGTVKASGSGYSVTMDNAQVLADNGLGNTGALISGRLQFTNGTSSLMTYGVAGMIYQDVASSNATLVEFITPTGNRVQSFPDEGTVGLPGTFVTHTTKDPLTFNNGTLQTTVISNNNVLVSDGGANKQGSLQPGAAVIKNASDQITIDGVEILYNGISGFTSNLFFDPVTTNRVFHVSDDDNGNVDINHIGTNTQSLSGVTTMVIPHGRSYTPSMVIPVQRSAIGAATNWYVSAITSTNFTITFNASVTASVTFDFKAIK